MGTCASTNVHQLSREYGPSESSGYKSNGPEKTGCKKHGNTVTHFNEKSEQLYCLSCYQDYKRKHTRAEYANVHEIPEYMKTFHFKQTEIQILEKLRINQHSAERKLLQISQVKNKLENKRSQILDEIKLFVNTVIDLLKHLEEELCRETNDRIKGAIGKLNNSQIETQNELKRLLVLKNQIERNSKNETDGFRLESVIQSKNVVKKNNNNRNKVNDYEPVLKLNKYISLNDIYGKKGNTKKVSLGHVTCDIKRDKANDDILSDISETASDDSTYTQRSSTQNTNTTSGANSAQLINVDNETDTSHEVPTTSTPINTGNPEFRVKSESSVHEKEQIKDETKNGVCENDDVNLHDLKGNERLSPVQEVSDKSQNLQQYLRDNAISRNLPRRVSYSGTPSLKTPTPRRSSQSIVSPGNITSPYFISPRPRQHLESIERRLAVKFREIKIPRDEEIPNITDTTELSDGTIILCDQKNEKLMLLDKQFDIKDEIKLSGHPHNVANVSEDRKRVAVTIPDENVVKIVEVFDEAFDEKIEVIKLQSKPKCRGIEHVDDNLIYTTRNDVAVLRKEDSRTWKFKYAFRDPVSLFADRRNDVVFVSCLGLKSFGEVVKMHYKDEKIDFVISCNEIQHPVCSTVDGEGYIYICDIDPPAIHQVSPDGKYCRRLLSADQGKFQHVNFLKGRDLFIVTENDSETVHIYEMV